jgi:aminoglycoside phosphotransferase (APT) family kinase protein
MERRLSVVIESPVDFSALAAWMSSQGLGSGTVSDIQLLAGGTQNILARFRFADRDFVLRHPPAHLRANSNETMRREARVLAAIASTNVPHPGLIAACPDDNILGGAFYLMEPVNGFNATTGLLELHAKSPAVRHRMGLAIAEGAAALGNLDHLSLGLEGFGRPEKFLERQVARWGDQLGSYAEFAGWSGPREIPGVDKVASWLEANRPEQGRAGILHGDYHLANVMYAPDSGELAAIVDWELATIGDPLLDLGWLLATWPDREDADYAPSIEPWEDFPSSAELVAQYGKFSDRDLAAIDWYAVLACYKLGILLEGSHARASAGKAPREIGDRLHAKTISLFQRALRWIG